MWLGNKDSGINHLRKCDWGINDSGINHLRKCDGE